MEQTIILVLSLSLAALIQNVQPAAIPGFNECMFNDRFYQIGESFHPIVSVRGREYEAVCYNCTCQPTTIAQCEEVHCPPADCEAPIRLDGECCPVCIPPVVLTGPKDCVYEGLSIPHGEDFHPPSMVQAYDEEMKEKGNSSTSSAINASNPFCKQCRCNDGNVQCIDISSECPLLTCSPSEAFLTDGNCCMECPMATPLSTPMPTTHEVCIDFDGSIYNEGDTWHPYYPGFGRVDCHNCTCVGGNTKCVKDPCPDVPYCEPNEPIPDIVICCFKCKIGPAPSPVPTTDQMSNKTATVVTPIIIPCKTKDYVINIFKHLTNDSLAIENSETLTVDIYAWIPSYNGDLTKSIISLDSVAFQGMKDYQNFQFIGKTLLRRVNGLTTRESKRQKILMCREDCSSLVVNMLRPVDGDLQCSDE